MFMVMVLMFKVTVATSVKYRHQSASALHSSALPCCFTFSSYHDKHTRLPSRLLSSQVQSLCEEHAMVGCSFSRQLDDFRAQLGSKFGLDCASSSACILSPEDLK